MSYSKKFLKLLIPLQTQNHLQLKRAQLAAYSYGHPAKRLTIIGVIGSHGKTTTAHLITHILQASGYKVGLISSICFQIDNKITKNHHDIVTLDPFLIQQNLRQMVRAGCRYAVLELSAYALSTYRYLGIDFNTIVTTNFSPEKIENFTSFPEYLQTYKKLFSQTPLITIVNADDSYAPQFSSQGNIQYTYSSDQKADFLARKILPSINGIDFTAITPKGQYPINLNFPGRFNVANALAAVTAGYSQGIAMEKIAHALRQIDGIAGRMEKINEGQNFNIIIDCARTPEALEMVYDAARKTTRGNLIAVLGAAGNKNPAIRPILGEIAGRCVDHVILTSEDPYTENPDAIIAGLAEGLIKADRPHYYRANTPFKTFRVVSGNGEGEWWHRMADRHSAIEKALSLASRGDTIIITGKGDDETMAIGDQFIPYSDKKTVEDLLEKILPPKASSHQKIVLPSQV